MNKKDVKLNIQELVSSRQKLKLVGFIKSITAWGLKESKDFVDEHEHNAEKLFTKLYDSGTEVHSNIKKSRHSYFRQFLCNKLIEKYDNRNKWKD